MFQSENPSSPCPSTKGKLSGRVWWGFFSTNWTHISETTFGPHMLLVFVPVVASQLRNWRTPSCFFLLNICFICPGCDYRFREKVETACLCPVIVNIKVSWGTWLMERSHFATYPSLKVTIPWSTQCWEYQLGCGVKKNRRGIPPSSSAQEYFPLFPGGFLINLEENRY